jgi:hypothetical protein
MSVHLVQGPDSAATALEEGDNRTLRLSVPSLTGETLSKLIDFWSALVAELKTHRAAMDAAAFAKAHDDAAAKTGLGPKVLNELEAVARSFAGERWTLRTMEKRLERARTAAKPSPKDAVAIAKLPAEIAAKKSGSTLQRRYREDVIALLETREDDLIALHEALTALLRR